MGRPNRIQLAGGCYWVSLRGNNRQDIFLSNQDRRHFLSLLKAFKAQHDLCVYAYCLMNNSIDLLMETRRPNLSRVMQVLGTTYTKYFNRTHNTSGHLFQGRYRALLVDKDRYLLETTCAIHLKPVHGAVKEKPWRYLWSSCSAYVESGEREAIVDTEPVLRLFAKNRLKQSVKYLHYIKERLRKGAEPTIPLHRGMIGSPEFAAAMSRPSTKEGAAVADATAKARQILIDILRDRKIDEAALLGRGQWRGLASARKEAIHRIWKEAKLGVTELGRMFQRTPSAVSQLIRSVESPRDTSGTP